MGTTFLVIDDSYIDRLVAGMLIKRTFENPEVVELSGAKEALDWLASHTIDGHLVILLDIMMPSMNGFEFLSRFEKMHESTKGNTTIFMLSSTLDHEDIARAEKHPLVEKLLSKPLSEKQLKQLLERAVRPGPHE